MGKDAAPVEKLKALLAEVSGATPAVQKAFHKRMLEAMAEAEGGGESGGEGASSASGGFDEKDYFRIADEKREDMLQTIRQEIRRELPTGDAPDEATYIPQGPEFEGWAKENVQNVDAFLYNNDEELDEAVDEGVLARFYCTACHSRKIKPLNFVSHSASLDQVRFIFGDKVLGDLKGKVVVDVGSRIGAVTFAAAVLTEAKEAVGIERNKTFAELQARTAKRFKLGGRVKVIAGDAKEGEGAAALKRADVVVLNNVFQFFSDGTDALWAEWQAVRASCGKKGQRLVTIPSLKASVAAARPAWGEEEVGKWLAGWVREEPLEYPPRPEGCCDEEEGGGCCGEGGGGCCEPGAKRAKTCEEKHEHGHGHEHKHEMDEQDEFRRVHLYTVL